MQTRLALFCDRVIEAGWLVAAMTVPLFFNIYSSRVFEPDKLTLLRSIALVMCLAWAVKALEGRGIRERVTGFFSLPLVIPTLILVGVYLLTTITSIVPRVSLWGSYQRLQGTYTTLSYVVIFFLTLLTLKTRRQLDRLVTVMVIVSLPVALYGIVQHFKLDPLPWVGDVTYRVASSMGNSIFVAAYLIMVVPLTLGRFVSAFQTFWEKAPLSAKGNIVRFRQRGGYIFLLLLQALALLYFFFYLIFFLSDVDYIAGGTSFALLWGFLALFVLSVLLLSSLSPRWGAIPTPLRVAKYLFLLVAQGLALVYSLLLIFKLNHLVYRGETGLELLALGGGMLLFVVSFWFTFQEEALIPHLLGVLYTFLLALQLACIIFTQSRGPLIGLLVGLFVFISVLAVRRRIAWLWLGALGLASAGVLFLVLFNLPNTPLASMRELPYIGRLGRVFETETGTGKVRVLIWEGAVELIAPHEPLGLPPDSLDRLNSFRPLIGYGPESMYVAFSRFYPPELGHYEARNKMPDRSHNETFDVLVTTGFLGFLAYIFLFGSLFYYGFKWLGFIGGRSERNVYVILWSISGFLGAVGPRLLEGTWRLSGVGLAVGLVSGLLAYLVAQGLFSKAKERANPYETLLVALLSAIVAHFIEIHFGIAIAATRTYFWLYVALLIITGYPLLEGTASEAKLLSASKINPKQKRRKKRGVPETAPQSSWWEGFAPLLPYSLLVAFLLITLTFGFLIPGFDPAAKGFSIPWLFFLTWALATCLIFAEIASEAAPRGESPLLSFLSYGLISLGLPLIFALSLRRIVSITSPATTIEEVIGLAWRGTGTVMIYYLATFGLLFLSALALMREGERAFAPASWPRRALYPLFLPLVAVLIFTTNINPIQADTIYKQGLEWDSRQQWDASIAIYEETIKLAPDQDWYYIFLARSILEKAKTAPETTAQPSFEPHTLDDLFSLTPEQIARLDRGSLMKSGQVVLEKARAINPLNTDHLANLGRIYNIWGGLTKDPEERRERLQQALHYYQEATTLSPHNAQLMNEWGQTYQALEDYEKAIAKFQESLALDPEYGQTYLLLIDTYAVQAHQEIMFTASEEVRERINLGYFYIQKGDLEGAIQEFLAIAESNDTFGTRSRLALLFYQTGRLDEALAQAQLARDLANPTERPFWDALIAYWGT
ncbi:MAG: tetratricopeptide repeat protein [Anaerolineae bacterium]